MNKTINKEVFNENTGKHENIKETRPHTFEENQVINKNNLKFEHDAIISELENTKWIYDKQKDLGLSDEELKEKHGNIINSRVLKRAKLQELQEELAKYE